MNGLDATMPLPTAETAATVRATADELSALAARLGVPAVGALECRFRLRPRHGGRFEAEGILDATVTLECRVSLEPFDATIQEEFAFVFVPESELAEETEAPDPDAPDEVPYGPAGLPLGEAAAEELALALPPYPRRPGVEMPDVATDAANSPFAVLAKLVR